MQAPTLSLNQEERAETENVSEFCESSQMVSKQFIGLTGVEASNIPDTFNKLIASYYPVVQRIATIFFHRYRSNFFYQDADDITQHVMMRFQKILENYATLAQRPTFENFLAACVRNTVLDMGKSNIAERGFGRRKLDHQRICRLLRIQKIQNQTSSIQQNSDIEITAREMEILEAIQSVLRADINAKKYLNDEEILNQARKSDPKITLSEIKTLMGRFEAPSSIFRAQKTTEQFVQLPRDEIERQQIEIRRALLEFQAREPALATILFRYYWLGNNDSEEASLTSKTKFQKWRVRQKALKKSKKYFELV